MTNSTNYRDSSDPVGILPELKAARSIRILKLSLVPIYGSVIIRAKCEGAEGVVVGNIALARNPEVFRKFVAPFFEGKDASKLPEIISGFVTSGMVYKEVGLPLWNAIAHAEMAILDALGKATIEPVWKLLGDRAHSKLPVYASSQVRDTSAPDEVAWVSEQMQLLETSAVKFKIGGRMGKDDEGSWHRSLELAAQAREKLGDSALLCFDGNGSFKVDRAIKMGRFLESVKAGWFEEPCPWEDFEGCKKVKDEIGVPVAAGEQESRFSVVRWAVDNKSVDVWQPDPWYCGGLLRGLMLSRYALERGVRVSLHGPRTGESIAPLVHLAAVVHEENPMIEYSVKRDKKPERSSAYAVEGGAITVPDSPGLGIGGFADLKRKARADFFARQLGRVKRKLGR